jgi:hypothetical protein
MPIRSQKKLLRRLWPLRIPPLLDGLGVLLVCRLSPVLVIGVSDLACSQAGTGIPRVLRARCADVFQKHSRDPTETSLREAVDWRSLQLQ